MLASFCPFQFYFVDSDKLNSDHSWRVDYVFQFYFVDSVVGGTSPSFTFTVAFQFYFVDSTVVPIEILAEPNLSILFCRFAPCVFPGTSLLACLSILFCRFKAGDAKWLKKASEIFQFYFVDSYSINFNCKPPFSRTNSFQFYFVDSVFCFSLFYLRFFLCFICFRGI